MDEYKPLLAGRYTRPLFAPLRKSTQITSKVRISSVCPFNEWSNGSQITLSVRSSWMSYMKVSSLISPRSTLFSFLSQFINFQTYNLFWQSCSLCYKITGQGSRDLVAAISFSKQLLKYRLFQKMRFFLDFQKIAFDPKVYCTLVIFLVAIAKRGMDGRGFERKTLFLLTTSVDAATSHLLDRCKHSFCGQLLPADCHTEERS